MGGISLADLSYGFSPTGRVTFFVQTKKVTKENCPPMRV